MDSQLTPLHTLLMWQQDSGADQMLETNPVPWTALRNTGSGRDSLSFTRTAASSHDEILLPHHCEQKKSRQAETQNIPSDTRPSSQVSISAAQTMDELRIVLDHFTGCRLKNTATHTCFADGNPHARIMLIGEAPGREEDIQGKPFVGRAGQLLDKMLAAIAFTREDVFITNIVFWRPPGNRNPTPDEAAACRPFTERQIELVNPDILVLLGGVAAQHILNRTDGIMRLRGRWHQYVNGKKTINVMATLHPAYLLRQPAQKAIAWRDFLQVKSLFLNGRI